MTFCVDFSGLTVDFFATQVFLTQFFILIPLLLSVFAYFVSKWLKMRSLTPFMLLWMVEIILFVLNLCAASLKDENYGFMSLVR